MTVTWSTKRLNSAADVSLRPEGGPTAAFSSNGSSVETGWIIQCVFGRLRASIDPDFFVLCAEKKVLHVLAQPGQIGATNARPE
jgi:hypothetical protein